MDSEPFQKKTVLWLMSKLHINQPTQLQGLVKTLKYWMQHINLLCFQDSKQQRCWTGHWFETHARHCVVFFSKTLYPLSIQETSQHYWTIVDRDINNQLKSTKVLISLHSCAGWYALLLFGYNKTRVLSFGKVHHNSRIKSWLGCM